MAKNECYRCEFREKCRVWNDAAALVVRGAAVGMFGSDGLRVTFGQALAEVCVFYTELPKEQV